MAKEHTIECYGIITKILRDHHVMVQLDDTQHMVLAYISGVMRKNQIRVVVGDRVTLEMSPHDPTKGRVQFRGIKNKDKTPPPSAG